MTRQGWWVLATGAAAAVAGRILGLTELYVLAGAAPVVVLAAAVEVRLPRLRLGAGRSVRPRRIPAGGSCDVELRLHNAGRAATPVLTLVDPVGDGRTSRLRLAALAGGRSLSSRYRLPAVRRGLLQIGPLRAERTDPLGLWRVTTVLGDPVEVMVLPRVHELRPLPAAPGDEPDPGHHHVRTLATAQEEFASLREYRPGDDVRKVHWPSTARHGTPIVRHYDEPWQRRTTLVVDVRAARHDEGSFERTVSAAASVLHLCATQGELVRLISTGGDDTGFIGSEQELSSAMDLLGGVSPSGSGSLGGTLRALVHRRSGGALVTCSGQLGDRDRSTLVSMGTLFALHLAVVTSPASTGVAAGDGMEVVAFVHEDDLGGPWSRGVDALGRRGAPSRPPSPPVGGGRP